MKKLDMQVTPKTIYSDIVNMPDPMLLGVTIHYHNYSDITLYMKIFGSGPTGWNTNSVELGSLTSGNSAYINLDNILSRTKPLGATTEMITLILRGYTDAGYSILFAEFTRTVTVIFIKSDDGSWTTDFSDNFNDGTVQGWAGAHIDAGGTVADYGTISVAVTTDYVLSPPYSLKLRDYGSSQYSATTWYLWCRAKLYKQFTTPNRSSVFGIIDLHISGSASGGISSYTVYGKQIKILQDSTTLIYLGKEPDVVESNYVPKDKWIRIVIPLPANTTLTLNIISAVLVKFVSTGGGSTQTTNLFSWLDDFKIISK